jgi:hypothetical protein
LEIIKLQENQLGMILLKAKKQYQEDILNTFKELDLENKLKDLAKEYTEFAINEIKEINGGEDVEKYFIEFFYYEWY